MKFLGTPYQFLNFRLYFCRSNQPNRFKQKTFVCLNRLDWLLSRITADLFADIHKTSKISMEFFFFVSFSAHHLIG